LPNLSKSPNSTVKYSKVTDQDSRIIREQLGREPKGVLGIAERCRYGYPTVLVTKPLIIHSEENYEVFPTLYWLSCPRRNKKLAEIEATGYIERLEGELNSNEKLRSKYKKEEQNYLRSQQKLLSEEEQNFVDNHQLNQSLNRGIGGIQNSKHIKCLHLHVAHNLVTENCIGKMIMDRFDLEDCPKEDVICEKFLNEEGS